MIGHIPKNFYYCIMKLFQYELTLKGRGRGFHVVTDEVYAACCDIGEVKAGLCHIFIQHTSASLTINEDASPDVRKDFEMYFNKAVPENDRDYQHNDEGSDDMPAHLKAALLGSSVSVPVNNGKFSLGTWQGIYLCEHRNNINKRNIIITLYGE